MVNEDNMSTSFKYRMAKHRQISLIRQVLPTTPCKKAAVVSHLAKSTHTRPYLEKEGLIVTKEQQAENEVNRTIFTNIKQNLQSIIVHRGGTMRKEESSAYKAGLSMISHKGKHVATGDSVPRAFVARRLDMRKKTLCELSQSDPVVSLKSPRATRKDAISPNVKEEVEQFWIKKSRPTGNKKDVVISRIGGLKTEHVKHVMENNSKTEIYHEFQNEHRGDPNMEIGQSSFEKYKPFFVKAPSKQDRIICLCRTHVDDPIVFRHFMVSRKQLITVKHPDIIIYERLSELVNDTLCNKGWLIPQTILPWQEV